MKPLVFLCLLAMSCRDSGINQTDVSDGLPHSQRTTQDSTPLCSQEEYWWESREKSRGIENERESEGGRQSVIRGMMSLKIRGQLSNLKNKLRLCKNTTFTVHASVETPQSKYISLLIPKLCSKT